MQAAREFRYWDHEQKKSIVVPVGAELSERAINVLGDAKVAQMIRTSHLSDETVVVNAPKRKRGRPKKGE